VGNTDPQHLLKVVEHERMYVTTKKYLYAGSGVVATFVGMTTGIVTQQRRLLSCKRMQEIPTSKYMPHQGARECARRRAQL
jgi:hypothetical protein